MSGRIVITGAAGQLGARLAAQAIDQGRDVLACDSAQWNITDPAAASSIVESGDVVINCAAYTDVDGAESDEVTAYAVNAAGPDHIARACARAGARLLHVSTDYVFNAEPFDTDAANPRPFEPSDSPTPLGVYGRSKRAGEVAVLAALPDPTQGIVVRTAWVYTGGTGKDFVAVMRRLAAGHGPIDVVDDQTGSPTYVADLAAALLQIADDDVPGPILHAANEGAVSRFEQARAVFEECGADPARVRPVSSAHNPRPAPRPTYSALSGRESVAAGMAPLRPWRPALVAALAASGGAVVPDRPIASTRD
ncbi:dTDP-4-dehydrorhamnose reductase [Mycobacterium shigaense]|uniref:dTDP-4-dehydrorhamnose reductase n=1 Tax=Mycobacterium shigaense TaxID=722731 RepID=A0A1Z4EEG3_9MYCO|nr:dTDP-4-dehydrorhamnose reductase [Mycobacterium shigaense]MEA1121901.1 dTDP-4-dehydrorhamnose reductase [Mycobacterium shigaense]PRI16134.1 dTDP-4-dehydrorhamnose reductase [Mycobacterium shigaense]BAX91334.1 dTDP-4-dehydrorhamnose reductase [Mycobacterium shigaense]